MSQFEGKIMGYKSLYNSENYKIYLCHVTYGANTLDEKTPKNEITVAGDMPQLESGVEYSIKATPKTTKYGLTYYIDNIYVDLSGKGRNAYYKGYLESITSQEQADVILKACPDFVNLILEGRDKEIDLDKIKGIKDKKFAIIRKKILDNVAVMDILEEYGEYELTFTMATRILGSCNGSIDLVREKMKSNPYKLLTDISGIGFKRADQLIVKIRPDLLESKYRLFSCAEYVLAENENNGSTWMFFKDLYKTIGEYAPEALKNVVQVIENTKDFYFDKTQNRIARANIRFKENYVAERIMDIYNSKNAMYDWKSRINEEPNYEDFRNLDGKFNLSDEQMLTLKMVFHTNFSVLTGSAGMGKSSGAKGLLNMMDKYSLSYTLTAPTGAASEVLSKYTERQASTIHKVIYRNPEQEQDTSPMIVSDLLVIDEASMINIDLMFNTLKEVEDGTKVLLICDPEQIPAIGAGKIIHDIIESRKIPVNKLTKVYRFDDGGLAQITTKVRLGQKYLPEDIKGKSITFGKDSDYSFILSEKDKMLKDVLKVYFALAKTGIPMKDIGIMSSMNVKDLGTRQINEEIQKIVSKGKPFVKYGTIEYRLGDKVMQIRNNYQADSADGGTCDIFNGNQGIISEIDEEGKRVIVKYSETKEIVYFQDSLKDLSLAYATSVHKFQGSGCRVAIVLTPSSHTFMLNKNLLYTALTRSTERTIHFSDKVATVNMALKKSENFTRNTFLKELLINN